MSAQKYPKNTHTFQNLDKNIRIFFDVVPPYFKLLVEDNLAEEISPALAHWIELVESYKMLFKRSL